MLRTIPVIALALALSSCAGLQQSAAMTKDNALIKDSMMATTSSSTENGLITLKSRYSVKQTADRFEAVVKEKGLTLFTRIDHQKNAMGAGLSLRPTEVIIFGNPKAGTPLMRCAPSVAIDLPQKALISEDATGQVTLTYNDPEYLKSRHNIAGCDKVLGNVSMLLNNLATTATR